MSSVSILPMPHVHIQLLEWSPWWMRITHFFLILFTNIWVFPAPLLDLVIVLTSAVTTRWLRVTNIPKENSVSFELTNLGASYLIGLKKLDEVPSFWSLASVVAFLLFLLACFSWSPGKTASSVVFFASHGGLAGSRHIQCKRLQLWHLGLSDWNEIIPVFCLFSHLQIDNASHKANCKWHRYGGSE